MARPRGRKKVKNPSSKVSRKVNKRRKRVTIKSDPLVAAAWDRKLTLCQNYARLGLVSRANFAAGGVELERKPLLDPTEDGLQDEEQAGDGDDDDLRERLLADGESEAEDNGPDPGEADDASRSREAGGGSGGRRKEKAGKNDGGKRKIDPSKIPAGMGFIERDEVGNVVNVVVGTREEVDPRDIEELPHVPAKTKLVQ
ncbi:MAG: ribosome biogenesis protein Nop16, partial [Olpidium bornovanus]